MPQSDVEDITYVLDPVTAAAYARARGLDVAEGSARLLSGGVSSTVVALDGEPPIVLKQALPRLRVAAAWDADPARSSTEARALALLRGITPRHVPRILDADPASHILALERAPLDWGDWRTALLAGPREEDVDRGRLAGGILGRWHAATWGDAALRSAFDAPHAFEQLRLDPFHRELLRRDAAPAAPLELLVRQLAGERQCLVHGDYSPKNVLVGDGGMWVIDAEVAHFGAAVFDLAFLTAHLALKALHLREAAALLERVALAFLAGYAEANAGRVDPGDVARHAAAIMLARVDGKSPAGYLSDDEASRARRTALAVLGAPDPSTAALWQPAVADSGGVS